MLSGIEREVDVPLPRPLFDVGQAVPLLGGREQALAQEGQLGGEDGQLASLGQTQAAIDTDDVAHVEFADELPVFLADLVLAQHHLNRAGPVTDLKKRDLPLTALEHDPTGDSDLGSVRFFAFGGLGQEEFADVGDALVVVEPLPPGIEAQGLNLPELVQPRRFQTIQGFFRHCPTLL